MEVDPAWVDLAARGWPLGLLVLTYFTGSALEARHYRSIRRREQRSRRFAAVTLAAPPADWPVVGSQLVSASVVISLDYFKRFVAALRSLVGGRVRSYETLLDRARREAVLRVKEAAFERGCHAVVNLRFETTRLNRAAGGDRGTAGVEVLAYGTALVLARPAGVPPSP
jgi:uncharacterized protein YbjQ (UPF0145 family)